jgi:predicted GNAT family N-acyltransferase
MWIELRLGGWQALAKPAVAVRHEVFVDEQGVPAEIELDEHDISALHIVAFDEGRAVATGRLLADGHIGRLAVLRSYRGRGLGRQVLTRLVEEARNGGLGRVELNAQTQALPFYERLGFVAYGEVFDDAGLPHRAMALELTPPEGR